MRESMYVFNVMYNGKCIMTISAHTKWEAINKAMYKTNWKYNRSKVTAKKMF